MRFIVTDNDIENVHVWSAHGTGSGFESSPNQNIDTPRSSQLVENIITIYLLEHMKRTDQIFASQHPFWLSPYINFSCTLRRSAKPQRIYTHLAWKPRMTSSACRFRIHEVPVCTLRFGVPHRKTGWSVDCSTTKCGLKPRRSRSDWIKKAQDRDHRDWTKWSGSSLESILCHCRWTSHRLGSRSSLG